MTALLVVLGAMVGAPARYLIDLHVQSRHRSVFPWGTFTINIAGSFVLGVVAAAVSSKGAPEWLYVLVGTGLCGAMTTFSTFGFETVRLVEDGEWSAAIANAAGSLVVGLGAVALGWWLTATL